MDHIIDLGAIGGKATWATVPASFAKKAGAIFQEVSEIQICLLNQNESKLNPGKQYCI